jgi:hypothetical protein
MDAFGRGALAVAAPDRVVELVVDARRLILTRKVRNGCFSAGPLPDGGCIEADIFATPVHDPSRTSSQMRQRSAFWQERTLRFAEGRPREEISRSFDGMSAGGAHASCGASAKSVSRMARIRMRLVP